ncbi:hypothetical protein ADICYQ_0048 [Cyclobacterium qasimii M12-11B]|uniref:Lipoprotein n=1 Tax=Cyclobacterium qasimii M12-11B TaxID=641524 RepID=S7VNM0_9BACT|nr:hypothetical protein ADICYQ_0048 [Cyclobacterium qasimii M12-11B]
MSNRLMKHGLLNLILVGLILGAIGFVGCSSKTENQRKDLIFFF